MEMAGEITQTPRMTPFELVNRYHLDSWNEEGQYVSTPSARWFSSKSHWCNTPYRIPEPQKRSEYHEAGEAARYRLAGSAVALESANINFQPNHAASRQLALQAAPGHGCGLGIQLTRENEGARAIGSAGDLPANRRLNWRRDGHLLVLI